MTRARTDAGFTLVEVLIAMVILIFGIVAVTNLFLVGATSNQTGNQSSAATTQASEVMERLKAIPFLQLKPGGDLDQDKGTSGCSDVDACVTNPDNYNVVHGVPGVGRIRTRWTIANPAAGGVNVLFITVRSEAIAVMGRRSRAEFTTFRACTVTGCPT